MKNRNNKAGVLALLGLGAGVFAWWKYKNLTPEEKLKTKLDDTGAKIKETYNDVEETLTEKYTQLKDKVKQEVEELAS